MKILSFRLYFIGVFCLFLTVSAMGSQYSLCPTGTDICYIYDSGCLVSVEKSGVPIYQAISESKDLSDIMLWKLDFLDFRYINQIEYVVGRSELTNTDPEVTVDPDPVEEYIVNEMGQTEHVYIYTFTHSQGITVYVAYSTIDGEDFLRFYIQVVNNRTPRTGWEDTRLMQIHFPFTRLGPESLQSAGETLPPPEQCYLSMDHYLIKNPAGTINRSYPYDLNNRELWHGVYGAGEGLPFHIYYETHKESNPVVPADSHYWAVYNTFGYPCEVNFYKHSTAGDGSFFLDIVQFPSDNLEDSGNSLLFTGLLGRPGFYIEYRPMDGGWYEAADYYRTRSEEIGAAVENPPPGVTPPVPPYDVDPVWTSATLRNGADIPEWVKTCPFFIYISPQVSVDDQDFETPPNSGVFPVYERADAFMDYMYGPASQHTAVAKSLTVLKKAVALTWPMKPFSVYDNNDWPEWRGGKMPIWNSNYNTFCYDHTTELYQKFKDDGRFRPGVSYGAHYWVNASEWVRPGTPTPTPYPDHPIFDGLVSTGSVFNADWGFGDIVIPVSTTTPTPTPGYSSYTGSIPKEVKGVAHYLCPGAGDVWESTWRFGSVTPTPKSGFQSMGDDFADGGLIQADALYMGAFSSGMCIGDFVTGGSHSDHDRNGSNWMTARFRTMMDDFKTHYSGDDKFWITEALGETMLREPVAIAFPFFPPLLGVTSLATQEKGGGYSGDFSGLDFSRFNLVQQTKDSKTVRYKLENVIPVPIPQVVLHEKNVIADGMSGWVNGTEFHRGSGTTLNFRFNYYKTDETGADVHRPLRSLNADLGLSYVWGNRFIIDDVDIATDNDGTPLPSPAPYPSPAPTPESSYSFLEEPYYAPARDFLADLLASYVYNGRNGIDRVYKSLFRGRMMKSLSYETVFGGTPQLAYDVASGFTWWETGPYPYIELNCFDPVVNSVWRTTIIEDPGELRDPYGERVMFTFVNFTENNQNIQIKPTDLTSYFSPVTIGTYNYYYYEYVPPGAYSVPKSVLNEHAFNFKNSISINARSVKNFGFYRVLSTKDSTPFVPGIYALCNEDPYSDLIKIEDSTLNIYPGVGIGVEDDPVKVAEDVITFQCFNLNEDDLSDFVCLNETSCRIYLSSADFEYDEAHSFPHHCGVPIQMAGPEIDPDCVRFKVVFSHHISEIKISDDVTNTTIRSLMMSESPIEKAVINLIDNNDSMDAIITTTDSMLLGIRGTGDDMEEIMEIPLPEDVELSGLDDPDYDSDLDIILEYTGKGKKSGKELVLKNTGEWKFN